MNIIRLKGPSNFIWRKFGSIKFKSLFPLLVTTVETTMLVLEELKWSSFFFRIIMKNKNKKCRKKEESENMFDITQ